MRAQPFQSYRGRINNLGRGQGLAYRDFYQQRFYSGETRARGKGRSINRGNLINQQTNRRDSNSRNWRQRSNSFDRYVPYNRPGTPTFQQRLSSEWNNNNIGNHLVESEVSDNNTGNTESTQTANISDEHNININSHVKPAYFLAGKIEDGEAFMLCDTGSSVCLIDDSIWDNIKDKTGNLNDVNYSLRSASKHSLDIIGEMKLTFGLLTKKGSWQNYKFQFMVVRGLLKPVILGMNFFHANKALIDLYNNRVFLYKGNTKTTYQLVGSTCYALSTEILLQEQLTLPPRTVTRIECQVNNDICDGEEVIFEPNRELGALVAASVDIVKDNKITIEITNVLTVPITLKTD